MEFGKRDGFWMLGLFVLSYALLLPGALWGLPGGKSLNGALVILEGGVPYRDFWTMYAPGPYYLTAAVFAVFGKSVLIQGLFAIGITALAACTFYALVRRLGSGRAFASILGLLLTATLWTTSPEIKTYVPALVLLFLALERFVAFLQRGGVGKLLACGAYYGIAAAFKHDVAAYLALATTIGLLLTKLTRRENDDSSEDVPLPRAVSFLALGCFLTFAPWAGYIAIEAGRDAVEDLIVFPLGDFRAVRAEPYPAWQTGQPDRWLRELGTNLGDSWSATFALAVDRPSGDELRESVGTLSARREWLLAKLPEVFFPLALLVVAVLARRTKPWKQTAALMFLIAMPFFWNAAHVQQNTHFYTMPLLAYLLIALAWSACGWLAKVPLLVALLLFAQASLINPVIQVGRLLREWPKSQTLDTEVMEGMRVAASDHALFDPIVNFLRANLREDERFYAGLGRHDSIVINDLRFHYLADRPSATRHHELHPGIADREEVQREIIADLERHDVRAVVLWDFGWSKAFMDELLARAREHIPELGSTLLDEYLAEHFETIARYGEYRLLWRRDLPPPPFPPKP